MRTEVAITIDAPTDRVWALVSDIENAGRTISATEEIEVLDQPADGLVGLKWRETRTVFGKAATETMWITEADDRSYYRTEARSHGSVYKTHVRLAEEGSQTRLSMEFDAEATTMAAKVLSGIFGKLMMRGVRKALLQDLRDTKAAAEEPPSADGSR